MDKKNYSFDFYNKNKSRVFLEFELVLKLQPLHNFAFATLIYCLN